MISSRIGYIDHWGANHLVSPSSPVRAFLTVIYLLAKPFVKLKIHPNLITLLGGLLAILASLLFINQVWVFAGLLAGFSTFLDGIDGAVATIQNKRSKFGAVLDAVVDRIAETSWFLALLSAGANIYFVLAAVFSIFCLEYFRTKGQSLGVTSVGAVTVAERPTRVIMFSMLSFAMPLQSEWELITSIGALIMALLAAGSAVLVLLRFTNQIRNNSSR